MIARPSRRLAGLCVGAGFSFGAGFGVAIGAIVAICPAANVFADGSQPSTATAGDPSPQGAGGAPSGDARSGGSMRADPRVRHWGQVVLWSLVLLLVFAAAAAAIVHFSRRYRAYLLHERDQPTDDADVWSMHRPPPDPPAEPPAEPPIEPSSDDGGGADGN
jgi:hypothetical protein